MIFRPCLRNPEKSSKEAKREDVRKTGEDKRMRKNPSPTSRPSPSRNQNKETSQTEYMWKESSTRQKK